MARNFRFYEKKRGNRRTGSRTLGSAGEVVFFALFLFLGCAGLAAVVLLLIVPEWRVNHEFIEHTCIVLDKQIAEQQDDEDTLYRPEVNIEYQIGGQTYRVWTYDVHMAYSSGLDDKQVELEPFLVGQRCPCWYDPLDPGRAVLVRQASWWVWLALVVPLSFILIGGGGVIYRILHWGKSAERRAVIAQRVQQRDLFNTNGDAQREFPNVPDGADITNSPGTMLKFRLPIASSPGWALFGVSLACLLWNGIVAVFVAIAIAGHLDGDPDWILTLFTIPFLLVGILLVVMFIRQLLVTTGIGPTLTEVSEHPLHPGESCRLFVSQSGRLKVNSIEVLLVCEEEATYRQGTDTRTETREVHRQRIFRREGFEVHRGLPFEAECELAVPVGAMHSFKADHNEVNWKVVVEGDVAGWPDYKRYFPVIVRPGNGRADA